MNRFKIEQHFQNDSSVYYLRFYTKCELTIEEFTSGLIFEYWRNMHEFQRRRWRWKRKLHSIVTPFDCGVIVLKIEFTRYIFSPESRIYNKCLFTLEWYFEFLIKLNANKFVWVIFSFFYRKTIYDLEIKKHWFPSLRKVS